MAMRSRPFGNVLWLTLAPGVWCALLAGLAHGQEDDALEPPDETAIEVFEQSGETLPPPDDDVMRPTRSGFRISPEMVRYGTQQWLEQQTSHLDLTDTQANTLTDRISGQVMEFVHANASNGSELVELLLESRFAERAGTLGAERRQELGHRLSEMVPALRELFRHVSAQARPVLTDAQWDQWKEDLAEELGKLHRLEAGARRWAEGKAGEGERIGDLDKDPNAEDGTGPQARRGRRRRSDPLEHAKRNASRTVAQLIDDDGSAFLEKARDFFGFDESQMDRAQQLLTDYQAEAEALKTPAFREALTRNRVKYYLRWYRPVEHPQVWTHVLDDEYTTLLEPWEELTAHFKSSIMALATPEQRERALADVRQRAIDLGLSEAEVASLLAGRFEP